MSVLKRFWPIVLAGVVSSICLLSYHRFTAWRGLPPDEALKVTTEEFAGLVDWIENYQGPSGKYPKYDEIPLEWRVRLESYTPRGGYRATQSDFSLIFGDALRDGFSVYYDSDSGHWTVDT